MMNNAVYVGFDMLKIPEPDPQEYWITDKITAHKFEDGAIVLRTEYAPGYHEEVMFEASDVGAVWRALRLLAG